MHPVYKTEQTNPQGLYFGSDDALLRKMQSIPDLHICMPSRAGPEDMGERQPLPLYPLDSLTPFVAGPAGPDPGLHAESISSPVK